MSYSNNINLQIKAIADPGRTDLTIINYEWKVNTVLQSNNTDTLIINTSSLPLGDSTINLRFQNSCLNWSNYINNTITITLPSGSIVGNIKNTSGTNIIGATVSDGTRYAITDTNGNYTISNVPVWSYTVTASATGYTLGTQPATVVAGQTTTLNFTLQIICPTPICAITITQT